MNFLGPTRFHRLNEAAALVFLFAGLLLTLSLVSYSPQDPSWDSISGLAKPHNLIGPAGAHIADLCIQFLGAAAFGLPLIMWVLAWKWIRSQPIEAGAVKILGILLLLASVCVALSLAPARFASGGVAGLLLAGYFVTRLNVAGTLLCAALSFILSIYLISRFSMSQVWSWFDGPKQMLNHLRSRWAAWWESRREAAARKAQLRAEQRAQVKAERQPKRVPKVDDTPPWETASVSTVESPAAEPEHHDIPIQELEFAPQPPAAIYIETRPPEPTAEPVAKPPADWKSLEPDGRRQHIEYHVPPTDILNEPAAKASYDSFELKEIATRIKSKLEEFNVLGNVVQINPGPVVTTFEFKPEAGIKYSRITTLNEDLCLGLQAESILIERIPGKPTVGVEVPNSRREVISLRQILESEEFQNSPSKMTICLGKDINGRIKVAALESMPHLLIAGSTGSGKSVMLNSMIMSILYKATPDEVRMILVDPKRL
jgi:S-DNA-T family DNA segregation ATPase FtsK/SpoIIIE